MPARFKIEWRVSRERFEVVHKDISEGSEPGARFYILVSVSTLIAAFGLISNSTAVVIGAMLVAPLMTPIFGMALALVRSNPHLLGHAARAEIVGVALSVLTGFLMGLLYPMLEATPEMLARTQPHLLDLLVAVLAGFAGSYAVVDEKISPALPGVAIATAIVPPLANSGLCLSLGAYEGAVGSFLLFFANFLAVLLVASATFIASGMTREYGAIAKKDILRRFGLAAVGFIIVAFFLSNTLYDIVQNRRLEKTVNAVLAEEFSRFQATGAEKVITDMRDDTLEVLAVVHAPKVISPFRVKKIQDTLSARLKKPVELIVRTRLGNDVSAFGSTSEVKSENLDGDFTDEQVSPEVRKSTLAERTLREYFSDHLGFYLHEVEILSIWDRSFILASIAGLRKLSVEEVRSMEALIQERIDDPEVRLMIRYLEMDFYTNKGRIRYEWINTKELSRDQNTAFDRMKALLAAEFDKDESFFLENQNTTFVKDMFHVLIEVGGTKLFPKDRVAALEGKLAQTAGSPVKLYVWSKPEAVATASGYSSYEKVSRVFFQSREKEFMEEIRAILDASQ